LGTLFSKASLSYHTTRQFQLKR